MREHLSQVVGENSQIILSLSRGRGHPKVAISAFLELILLLISASIFVSNSYFCISVAGNPSTIPIFDFRVAEKGHFRIFTILEPPS